MNIAVFGKTLWTKTGGFPLALVCQLVKIKAWKLDRDDNANKIISSFTRKQISTTFTQPEGYNEVEDTICKKWLHKNQKKKQIIK